MKRLLMSIMLVLMLVSCGIGSNEMTTDRAYKSLLGFTQTDGDFLEYDKGRSMGEVIGVVKTGESKVEIMFTVLNEQCDYTCDPLSNGKATAFVTTDGKWILDCIEYEDEYGNIFTGRQECNVNRDMDEMATYQLDTQTEKPKIDSNRSTSGQTELQHSTENQSTGSSGNDLPDIYSGDTSQLSVREDGAVSITAFKSTYFAHLSRTESDDGVRIWGEQTDLPNPELIKQILEVDTAAVRLNTDNKISYIRCDETNGCERYSQVEATRFALGMGFIVYMDVDGILRGIGDVVVQDDGTIRRSLPYPGNLEQVIDFQIADQTTMTRKSDGSVAFWTGGQKSVYDSFPVEQLKLVRDVQFTPKIINTINQDGDLVEFRYANSSWVSRIITIPEKVTKFIDGDCATKGGRLLFVTENGATRQYFNDGLSTAGNVDVRHPMYCHYDPMDETYYLIGFNDGKEIVQQPLQ